MKVGDLVYLNEQGERMYGKGLGIGVIVEGRKEQTVAIHWPVQHEHDRKYYFVQGVELITAAGKE